MQFDMCRQSSVEEANLEPRLNNLAVLDSNITPKEDEKAIKENTFYTISSIINNCSNLEETLEQVNKLSTTGKIYRQASIDNIIETIKWLQEN